MNHLQKVIELSNQQHGVIARFQLSKLGVPLGSHAYVLKNKVFDRVGRGVFILRGNPMSWKTNATVAVLCAGPTAKLSHSSALINLELLTEGQRLHSSAEGFHVTSTREVRFRPNANFHRTIYVEQFQETYVHDGIPQVGVELAIIDGASQLFDDQLASVVDKAIRRGITHHEKLQRILSELNAAPGREKQRLSELLKDYRVIGNDVRRVESYLEKRVVSVIKKSFHAKASLQHPIRCAGRNYRIDIAIPEIQLAIEVDGFEFHRSRHEFDRDRARQNDLVNAGWRVLRFTSHQSDEQIIAAIRAHIPALGRKSMGI